MPSEVTKPLILAIHDRWKPNPTLCVEHEDDTCQVIAEFEDTEAGHQAAEQIRALLDFLEPA